MKRQGRKLVLLTLFAVVMRTSVASVDYTDTSGLLTSFPHDIPEDVEVIVISGSNIPVIDYIEPFPQLVKMLFTDNGLSTFPDLANLTDIMWLLDLSRNNLTTAKFPDMPRLRVLDLSYNRLTTIPDFNNVNEYLTTLYLSGNQLENDACFPPLPALTKIRLDEIPYSEFPDLTNISASLTELYISDNLLTAIDFLPVMPYLRVLKTGMNRISRFPDLTNVSQSLDDLAIYRTELASIDYIPKMENLRYLMLSRNQIVKFPNLVNVSSTLVDLDLSQNLITYVPPIPQMAALRTLKLERNFLEQFPDLSGAGRTLQVLTVFANKIEYIPDTKMASLRRLVYLDLSLNPLTSLPLFCHLNETIEVILDEPEFVCDWRMGLNKLAENSGIIAFSEDLPRCNWPSYFRNTDWRNISVTELFNITESGSKVIQNTFRRVDSSTWKCPLTADEGFKAGTVKCSAACSRRQKCFMFAIEDEECILTNGNITTSDEFNDMATWYVKY